MTTNIPPDPLLVEHIETLDTGLRDLAKLFRKIMPTRAFVTKMPGTLKGQENAAVGNITGEVFTSKRAIEQAISCYHDLYIKPDLSQKVARRSVGVIWIRPSDTPLEQIQQLVDCVATVNHAKNDMKAHITSLYANRKDRFESLRQVRTGLMTVQLYRSIKLFRDESIERVGLSWERKQLVDKVKPEKKIELLNSLDEEISHRDKEGALPLIQLKAKIGPVPAELLRLRRDVRVQPVANVTRERNQTITAVMPIVLIQNNTPKLSPIEPFIASERRKQRSDRSQARVLGTFNGSTIEERLVE
ncbi:DNA replication terminus site-binding protein [Gilvimarinus agarilyticus]|uniref:DNA replication terminus site-binding protein n=1 Tax=Gilvimarinus agarilyticus TaxID=679259 RepID=UPI000697B0B6|nr:DNA replication terminus site-binding protein [Gilvimarinus agarilyticus]